MKVLHTMQHQTPCLQCPQTQKNQAHLKPAPTHIYILWHSRKSHHLRKSGNLLLFGNPNGVSNQPGPRNSMSNWSMHRQVASVQPTRSFHSVWTTLKKGDSFCGFWGVLHTEASGAWGTRFQTRMNRCLTYSHPYWLNYGFLKSN